MKLETSIFDVQVIHANSVSDLYNVVGEDFWSSTWCNSTAFEGYVCVVQMVLGEHIMFTNTYFWMLMLQETTWGDKDNTCKNVSLIEWKFCSPFPFLLLLNCSYLYILLQKLMFFFFQGELGFDFAIRTPCTPARWEDYDAEMAMAWEVRYCFTE